jgi:hypothetical protein
MTDWRTQLMSRYRIYAYIVIGCIVGAAAGMAGHGLGIAAGIACGAGVAVALSSRPRGDRPRGRCGSARPPAQR